MVSRRIICIRVGLVAACAVFYLTTGAITQAGIRDEATVIVEQMDEIEKQWKPLLRVKPPRNVSLERRTKIASFQKRVRTFLELTAAVKREAERIRLGNTSTKNIDLLKRYLHEWALALNELQAAIDDLKHHD